MFKSNKEIEIKLLQIKEELKKVKKKYSRYKNR